MSDSYDDYDARMQLAESVREARLSTLNQPNKADTFYLEKEMSKQWEFRKDGFVYCKATGERVCSPHSTLPDSIKKWGPHMQDLKANARLIAAAPDLLEALKRLRDAFIGNSIEVQADALRAARAAIELAEGDTNGRG